MDKERFLSLFPEEFFEGENRILIEKNLWVNINRFCDLYEGVEEISYEKLSIINEENQYGHELILKDWKEKGIID